MKNKSLGFYLLLLILGSVVGSVMGDALGEVLPQGVLREFFLKSARFTVGPGTINLRVISLTLGFALNVNIVGVLGIVLVAYILRKMDS